VPPSFEVDYAGDEAFLFVSRRRPGVPLVLLAGHYDTVPEQGNVPGRIEGGAVHGLGASDMKGGLAVALELVRDLGAPSGPYDVGLLLFGREEMPADANPLPALFAGSSAVHEAALAILLEPTDLHLQVGCLGNVVARLTFHGRSGHSARPWLADNAIDRAIRGLVPLLELEPRVTIVGGFEFREVVTVTRLQSGIADNVVPGEATATVNLRYSPERAAEEAEAYLRELVSQDATLEVASHAPAGRVVSDTPVLTALRKAGDLELESKQAWTNVADFTARGIDAVNFGPGHTACAHRSDELVEIAALTRAYDVLRSFLLGSIREDAR
jgi:succinyl-diaminopimelate desuccinylase